MSIQTIEEGKKYLRENFKKGVSCPCCNQLVKLYKRKLNSVMARTLIRLYKLNMKENGYHHVSNIVMGISDTGTNDFSKLTYWGLIKEKPKNSDKTRTSGFWAITQEGVDFVLNKNKVPDYVLVYNGKCLGFSEETTTITESLNKHFNYQELMSNK